MLHKFCVWYIYRPLIMHLSWQSFQLCMEFTHLRIVYNKCFNPIQFNAGATRLFLYTSFFFLLLNIITVIPISNCRMNVRQEYIGWASTSRSTCFPAGSPISTLPWISQPASRAIHTATCGSQSIVLIIFSTLNVDGQHSQGWLYRCSVWRLQ